MNDRVIINPNFKNNGDFHRSLRAKGAGARDYPNTHTEVEYLGNGKFAASIGVGHRVFFDKTDGNKPKKHKLTDERPSKDYVLVQGAKCCVEVHPYYAKYFDVQHEEVRVYEERWVVQRLFKAPDKWRDVSAYNPQIAVEEYPEPAGDVVKVTVTYDTDYGPLAVEYFQRDGNNLKHNVSFKNTSGGEETFRVLQRWAGIVADRVNKEEITALEETLVYGFHFEKGGKVCIHENLSSFIPTWQEEVDAAKKMWVRSGECNRCGKCCVNCSHYADESPYCGIYEDRPDICKEFPWHPEQIEHISECLYSFEATGVTCSPGKLKSTELDVHPQGLKADFIYEDWVLAQGESLEIDPDTATLDNPTEDGFVKNLDAGLAYTRVTTEAGVWFYKYDLKGPDIARGYVEWDILGIPDGSTVTKVEFRYNGEVKGTDNCWIYAMANQPSIQTDDDAGNQVIYDDAGDGTAYLSNNATFPDPGTGKDVGGASGPAWDTDPKSDVESALIVDWFAFGFKDAETTISGNKFYSEDKTDAADPKPTLYVEYELVVGLENKSANMAAKMIGAGLI